MFLIYTTCKNTEEAVKIGNLIISRHLAACVNIWPTQSMYIWEGKLQSHLEAVLLIKTVETKLQAIEDLISSNHTYATPEIASLEVRRINRPYKEWMATVIR